MFNRILGGRVAYQARHARGFISSDPADARWNAFDARDAKWLRGSKPFAAQLDRGVQRAQANGRRTHRKYREGLPVDVLLVEDSAVPGGRHQFFYFESPTIRNKRVFGCDSD